MMHHLRQVPATFAGLSVGAKELKPALQRGTSFSSFSLGWKVNGESSRGVEVPERHDDVVVGSNLEPPKVSPRERLERSLERSHSRKQVEKAHEPSASSPKRLERSPHRTTKQVEKMHEHSITSPKPFTWSPLTATKHGESKFPFSATEPPSEPFEVSPGKTSKYPDTSPLRCDKSPLSALEIPTYSGSSPLKAIKSVEKLPRKSSKYVEKSSLLAVETPKPFEHSPSNVPKHVEKLPLSGLETPKTPMASESSPIITTDPRSSSRLGESRRRTKRMPVDMATSELEASPALAVCLSTVSQEFLLGEGITPGSARVNSLEVLQRQQFWTPKKARTDSPDKSNPSSATKRVDGSGLGSSRRSCSSRSLARSLHLDETVKHLSPQLTAVGTPDSCDRTVVRPQKMGVVLPREEIFPGNTNSLPQIRVRTPRIIEMSGDLSKNPLIGGSTRVTTQRNEIRDEALSRLSGSLPTSPRYTPGESRTARLLRRLKLSGRGAGAGSDASKLGTEFSLSQSFTC